MSDTKQLSEYETFNPSEYLNEYYLTIGVENDFLLQCAAKAYKDFEDGSLTILEVGGGPTVYQIVSSARAAKEIHFTDFSQANLDEVKKWLDVSSGSFDWDQFIKRGLENEGAEVSEEDVESRKKLIRGKVTKLSRYDVINNSLLDTGLDQYDLVSSVFSTDAITHSIDEWKAVLKNVAGKIKDKGWLILVGVLGSDSWVMGNETFKATNLSRQVVEDTLKEMGLQISLFKSIEAEEGSDHGYDSVFYVKARKN